MKLKNYFSKPKSTQQRHYEALRAFYYEDLDVNSVIKRFGFTASYFKKLRVTFKNSVKAKNDPIFVQKNQDQNKDIQNE
jgi:hypothetical protein